MPLGGLEQTAQQVRTEADDEWAQNEPPGHKIDMARFMRPAAARQMFKQINDLIFLLINLLSLAACLMMQRTS